MGGVRQDAWDGVVPRIAMPWRDVSTHGTSDGDLRRGCMGFFDWGIFDRLVGRLADGWGCALYGVRSVNRGGGRRR